MIKTSTVIKNIPLHSRWNIALKTTPYIFIVILLKYGVHYFGAEFLTMSPLFTAIISANIFLIGFLISGTLVDYKESEKLPGDLACSLEAIADETSIIWKNKKSPESKAFLKKISEFNNSIIEWFYKREKTQSLLDSLRSFNNNFSELELQTQPAFMTRMKQEQNSIRKMVVRIHTIRDTDFLGTGYAITEIITFILVFGLIVMKMEPFYEAVFFTSFVSFILIYMIYFIKDLDNPFGYADENSLVENVSLKPILDSQKRIDFYSQETEQ